MEEIFYTCPYCFSESSILVDLSVNEQEYIEDCERCCNPIEFTVIARDFTLSEFRYQSIEQ